MGELAAKWLPVSSTGQDEANQEPDEDQSSRIERRGAWSVFDLARRVHDAGGRIEYVQDSYLNDTNEMSDVMLALAATGWGQGDGENFADAERD